MHIFRLTINTKISLITSSLHQTQQHSFPLNLRYFSLFFLPSSRTLKIKLNQNQNQTHYSYTLFNSKMRESKFIRKRGEEYNVVISRKKKIYKDYECYAFKVASKYNPKVIFKYLNSAGKNSGLRNELRDLARMHLSAIGWSFWSKIKRGHDEWRYDSPSDKTYYSLNSACTAIKKGVELNYCGSFDSNVIDDDTLLSDHDENPKSCEILEEDDDMDDSSDCNAVDDETLLDDCEFVGEDEDLGFRKHREKRNRYACALSSKFDHESEVQEDEDQCRVSTGLVSKKRKQKSSRILRSSKRVRHLGAYSGSKNPRTVLSWLIENNVVVPRSKLYYFKGNSDVPLSEGRISSDGIKCNCCQKLFSLSGFQAHVVGNNICRPAENLFLENRKSLVSCQVELMRKKIRMFDQEPAVRAAGSGSRSGSGSPSGSENCNDYVCSICHYGGDLICCDRCPSSFHATCLNIESVPEGDWFCPSCCCGICGDSQFDMTAEQFADDSLLRCHQCERQFHAHCKKDREMVDSGEIWFCCKTCEMMQWGLQQLLGKPILVGHDNLTWTLIKPMQYQAEDSGDYDLAAMAENYSKLSVALEVMHECFDPVKDPKTKRDLVEDVLFCRGSNLNRLNFRGFYTVLLERNDELIAVALLRINGDKVAEMPLIGTRFQHRRLGMCRILVNEIEKTLLNLGVQKLVLPASPSVLNTWTTSFGFTPITESDRLEFLGFTFLDFHDTVMCKKLLKKRPTSPTHRSRNMSIILRKPTQNIEGSSVNHEGSSSISEVLEEEEHQGSVNVDQGAQANVTSKFLDHEKFEGDKVSLKLKFLKSKNGTVLMPLVPQPNYSNFEGSCRLVSPL